MPASMSDRWIVWRWGPRGPQIALLTNNDLDEHDRRAKLGDPIKLKHDEHQFPLSALAKLYPPPTNGEPK